MKIGIIGGVSPFAFSVYYNDLCEKYRKQTNGIYPQLLIYSIRVTEQQESNFIRGTVSERIKQEIKEELKEGCKIFKQNGIDTVVICCNTLSEIFYDVAKLYEFKNIITPVDCIRAYVKSKKMKKILLFATKYTNDNLYKDMSNIIKLEISEQIELEKYISNKINGNHSNNKILERIIEKYSKEVDSVILGCTDIEKNAIKSFRNIEVIDSTEIMINQTLEKMR